MEATQIQTITYPPKYLKLKSIGKDVEQLEFSYIACGNVTWYIVKPICKKFGNIYESGIYGLCIATITLHNKPTQTQWLMTRAFILSYSSIFGMSKVLLI